MPDKSLFTPLKLGPLSLPNRVVMAPLTRMRAHPATHTPTPLQATYYEQRADSGLIISEATAISPEGFGWAHTPGLWSAAQVEGWRSVTDAVHKAGGRIFAQLWHTGAMSHPELLAGVQPVSASDVNPEQNSVLPHGRVPTVTPRPLSLSEIKRVIEDFRSAAKNAIAARFDGVQVLSNYLYLIAQFLNTATNRRSDQYGGSLENRTRLLFEVLEAIFEEVPHDRVGIKLSPMHETGPFQANADTLPTIEFIVERLNNYKMSHLLLMGNSTDFSGSPIAHLQDDAMFHHFRKIYSGPLIASTAFNAERADRLLRDGTVDAVAFGRPYIANPDLVERLRYQRALTEVDWSTVYADGPEGYTDYPRYGETCAIPQRSQSEG